MFVTLGTKKGLEHAKNIPEAQRRATYFSLIFLF